MNRDWKFLLVSIAAAAALSACGDDSIFGGGSNNSNNNPTPTPNTTANPITGIWDYSEYAASSNTCNRPELVTNGDGAFGLQNNGNGTLTITPGDDTGPFPCTFSGGAYSCPDRAAGDYTEGGVDATLHAQASVSGNFSDDTHMSGTQTADVTCSGPDCAAVAAALGTSFPCQFEVDFQASWQNPLP